MSDLQKADIAKTGFLGKVDNFFGVTKSGSKFRTEIVAGLTTFFTMAYIIFVNPNILGGAGMNTKAVFLATIFATMVGTLMMSLFAKIPYAQAPGMGLNAFFAFTVCGALGFTWQQALFMVFICGIISLVLTVTKVRKMLFTAIPKSLQYAIAGGIGIFIAYIGLFGSGLIDYSGLAFDGVPALTSFNSAATLITLGGLILIIVLLLLKVKGAILIGIIASTIVSIILTATGVAAIPGLDLNSLNSISPAAWGESFSALGDTFGAAFGSDGMLSLFSDLGKLPVILLTIFAFSMVDIFDTVGTLIGTGRKSGLFEDDNMEKALSEGAGLKTKVDRALFADFTATSVGAILGTSNVTTYVESAAGIQEGGRTGLTSLVTAVLFALCILIAPVAGLVPTVATAPALIIVGVMMMSAFKNIDWSNLEEAIPAFFSGIVMAFAYSISVGIALGFIFYCLVKVIKGKAKEVHPILWGSTALFLIYFIFMALESVGIL